jgi:hypothetical protein
VVWRWNRKEVIRPLLLVPRYSWFKAAIFALLVLNTGTYLLSGTFSEGVDSIAWLALLALFELETGSGRPLPARAAIAAVHGIRFAALAAVGLAAAGFLYNEEWLDSANSLLWIAVVVLLEWGVRRPAALAAHRAWYTGAAAGLYAGLGALVFVWLWQGEWFAAYDAVLWLVAFLTIEMNVLAAVRRVAARPAPAGSEA